MTMTLHLGLGAGSASDMFTVTDSAAFPPEGKVQDQATVEQMDIPRLQLRDAFSPRRRSDVAKRLSCELGSP